MEIFCNINVFAVTFNQFNACLLNKSISFLILLEKENIKRNDGLQTFVYHSWLESSCKQWHPALNTLILYQMMFLSNTGRNLPLPLQLPDVTLLEYVQLFST